MARLTIDPVTRIEGHLRVDVEVADGAVQDAWSSCTMWRGIENILLGRDPREAWLFAQRFCGVCTTVHAMVSVRAVENALGLAPPLNAQLIRNLILLNHGLHDHIVHFYHLSALDWVDVTTIPKADPDKAAKLGETLSNWPGNSRLQLKEVQDKVVRLVQSGQLGIFAHGYWGHPAMHLDPEVNLLLVAHYFQALEYQRKANQVVAILGGKTPHIQNLAVGGVMNAINLDSMAAMNMDTLYGLRSLILEVQKFTNEVYFPDVCALGALYPEWLKYGRGVDNYLAVPDLPLNSEETEFDLPGGVIQDGDLESVRSLSGANDKLWRENVIEDVTHSWYRGSAALPPWQGETHPHYTDFEPDGKYSWVKAPRFEKRPAQVGPLSQILVGYAQGHPLTKKWTDAAFDRIRALGVNPTPEDLHSTVGRHLARAIRSAMFAELELKHWEMLVNNVLSGDSTTFVQPEFPVGEIEGVGVHEAPRGTLSHWVVLENGKIKNYQAVVPTTWNASPRDGDGAIGPYEASLIGNPVADEEKPLEMLRTLHSFDPCMACACHAYDPEGNEVARVRVL
jgi:hydrogenase large subunit